MSASARSGQALAGVLLGVLVGLSAMAFGSVELWAEEWLRFAILLLLGLCLWWASPRELLHRPAGQLALPVAMLVAWGLLQTVPLPAGVLQRLSPVTAQLYERAVPREGESLEEWLRQRAEERGFAVSGSGSLAVGASVASEGGHRALSLQPHSTRRACLSWLTALGFFLVGSWAARSPVGRYRLLLAVGGWAGLLGAIAVVQQVSWNGRLLWIRDVGPGRGPLGPFVNPAHFAGFVEMGLLITLGLGLALLAHKSRRLSWAGIRDAMLDKSWALPRFLVAVPFAGLGLTGLVLSRSQGGAIALATGLLVLVLARTASRLVPFLPLVLVVVGIAVAGVGGSGEDLHLASFGAEELSPSLLTRTEAWNKTFEIFLDHLSTGTGLGTFPWAFAHYQRKGEWTQWAHSHNDFLQLLSETGLVGAALLAWAVWILSRRVLWPIFAQPKEQILWTTAAAAAAVLALLTHSIVDFNLQIPSNAALFAVLLGVLAAASSDAATRRRGDA